MKEKEIKEKINEGYLRVRILFEIIGKPKEHVEKTMKAYLDKIATEQDITILEQEVEPVDEIEKGMFSVIGEMEVLVPTVDKLTWLAINFSPASIELIEPEKITLQQKEISNWVNDFLAKLHEIGIMQKSMQSQQEGLVRNFNAMTRNAIILCLNEPRDAEYIAKKIGMQASHAEKFLEALIKENKIKKDKTKYALAK
ncbi:MAG: hypothetical protein ACOCQQ_00090 [Candidatus Nanoarchaeia archaeon]